VKLPIENLEIGQNSAHLKKLCAKQDPEVFISDMANLISNIDTPGIEIRPFHVLD
jgi:hypothetical protein